MDKKELEYFEMVYKEQSINQAAKKLFITPQGLSKVIKKMENELDVVLFERTSLGAFPTKSAHFLYEKAEILKKQFKEIEYGVKQLESKKRILRIGCAMGVLNTLPIQMIFSFMEKYPELEIQWCEYPNQEVKDKVKSSEIDIGFVVGDYNDSHVVKKKLISRKLSLLVYKGHPLYEMSKVNVSMLKNEKLIVMNEQFHVFHEFKKRCLENDFTPNIVGKTGDGMLLHLMCKQKVGLAILPDFAIKGFKLEDMNIVPFEEDIRWEIHYIHKKMSITNSNIDKFKRYVEGLL